MHYTFKKLTEGIITAFNLILAVDVTNLKGCKQTLRNIKFNYTDHEGLSFPA